MDDRWTGVNWNTTCTILSKKFYFNMLDQRLIKMINRTMDVVFTRSGWNSFIITLRQKPRGVSHCTVSVGIGSRCLLSLRRLRETPLGFCLRVMVNEFHPNLEKTTTSGLFVILINLWRRQSLMEKGSPQRTTDETLLTTKSF